MYFIILLVVLIISSINTININSIISNIIIIASKYAMNHMAYSHYTLSILFYWKQFFKLEKVHLFDAICNKQYFVSV